MANASAAECTDHEPHGSYRAQDECAGTSRSSAPRTSARLFAASLLARLPIGINGLAIVLLVQAETGSFGAAGAAAGRARARQRAVRAARRAADRRARRRACCSRSRRSARAALLAIVALARAGRAGRGARRRRVRRPAPRSRRPRRCCARSTRVLFADRPALMQGAFALDSVLTESIFTVAPLLTAALVVLFEPAAALLVSAVARARRHGRARRGAPARATARARSRRAAAGSARSPCRASARSSPRCCRSASRSARSRSRCRRSPTTRASRSSPACWSRCGRSAASPAGWPTARGRGAARSRACTCASRSLLPLTFLPLALATSPATMALLVVPGRAC